MLASITDAYSTRWVLVRRLPAGDQQGAYELREGSGQRALLK
jgi:hypothetical protein